MSGNELFKQHGKKKGDVSIEAFDDVLENEVKQLKTITKKAGLGAITRTAFFEHLSELTKTGIRKLTGNLLFIADMIDRFKPPPELATIPEIHYLVNLFLRPNDAETEQRNTYYFGNYDNEFVKKRWDSLLDHWVKLRAAFAATTNKFTPANGTTNQNQDSLVNRATMLDYLKLFSVLVSGYAKYISPPPHMNGNALDKEPFLVTTSGEDKTHCIEWAKAFARFVDNTFGCIPICQLRKAYQMSVLWKFARAYLRDQSRKIQPDNSKGDVVEAIDIDLEPPKGKRKARSDAQNAQYLRKIFYDLWSNEARMGSLRVYRGIHFIDKSDGILTEHEAFVTQLLLQIGHSGLLLNDQSGSKAGIFLGFSDMLMEIICFHHRELLKFFDIVITLPGPDPDEKAGEIRLFRGVRDVDATDNGPEAWQQRMIAAQRVMTTEQCNDRLKLDFKHLLVPDDDMTESAEVLLDAVFRVWFVESCLENGYRYTHKDIAEELELYDQDPKTNLQRRLETFWPTVRKDTLSRTAIENAISDDDQAVVGFSSLMESFSNVVKVKQSETMTTDQLVVLPHSFQGVPNPNSNRDEVPKFHYFDSVGTNIHNLFTELYGRCSGRGFRRIIFAGSSSVEAESLFAHEQTSEAIFRSIAHPGCDLWLPESSFVFPLTMNILRHFADEQYGPLWKQVSASLAENPLQVSSATIVSQITAVSAEDVRKVLHWRNDLQSATGYSWLVLERHRVSNEARSFFDKPAPAPAAPPQAHGNGGNDGNLALPAAEAHGNGGNDGNLALPAAGAHGNGGNDGNLALPAAGAHGNGGNDGNLALPAAGAVAPVPPQQNELVAGYIRDGKLHVNENDEYWSNILSGSYSNQNTGRIEIYSEANSTLTGTLFINDRFPKFEVGDYVCRGSRLERAVCPGVIKSIDDVNCQYEIKVDGKWPYAGTKSRLLEKRTDTNGNVEHIARFNHAEAVKPFKKLGDQVFHTNLSDQGEVTNIVPRTKRTKGGEERWLEYVVTEGNTSRRWKAEDMRVLNISSLGTSNSSNDTSAVEGQGTSNSSNDTSAVEGQGTSNSSNDTSAVEGQGTSNSSNEANSSNESSTVQEQDTLNLGNESSTSEEGSGQSQTTENGVDDPSSLLDSYQNNLASPSFTSPVLVAKGPTGSHRARVTIGDPENPRKKRRLAADDNIDLFQIETSFVKDFGNGMEDDSKVD